MTYQQTLDYLFSTLPMFSRIGSAAFKKDLANTVALCGFLDNPQNRFQSVHIGGTNGKGSVSHMLAAIMQTAGYKTGLYTSPHLKDFRERIKINGEMITESFVIDFVEKTKTIAEAIQPSFFELTVGMAFDYFATQNIDIAIVEVGLGGRLDSTNILNPELAIITNIGWDHTNILGNSLQEIAGEKAGIIKENIPVIIGERKKETEAIFQDTAHKKYAPIYFAEDYYKVKSFTVNPQFIDIEISDVEKNLDTRYQLDLPGIYQTKNSITVLEAVKILNEKGWKIEEDTIATAFKTTKKITGLHGRWEVIQEQPTVVLEVAHNPEGLKEMLAHIQQLRFNKLHIVFGMVKDKDAGSLLELLPKEAAYYFTEAHIPRALDAETLKGKAAVYHLYGEAWTEVNQALQHAKNNALPDDLIIVCGSIFLVAEVAIDEDDQS